MAVYDEDALYARRLAEYVNRRETIPFTAMAFSNLERLKEYGDSHEIEILLVGETVKAAADEVKAGLKMVLCGGEFSIGKEEPSIYRFQSGEGILRGGHDLLLYSSSGACTGSFGNGCADFGCVLSGEPLRKNSLCIDLDPGIVQNGIGTFYQPGGICRI